MFDYKKVEKKLEEFISRMDKIDSLLDYLQMKEDELKKVVSIVDRLDDIDKLLSIMSIIDKDQLINLEKKTSNIEDSIKAMNKSLSKDIPNNLTIVKSELENALGDVNEVKAGVNDLFKKVNQVKKKQKQIEKEMKKIEELEENVLTKIIELQEEEIELPELE